MAPLVGRAEAEPESRGARDDGVEGGGDVRVHVVEQQDVSRGERCVLEPAPDGHVRVAGEVLRADDNPESLAKRLAAYRAQTLPLSAYYAHKGLLYTVDGMGSIDDVTAAIEAVLPGPPAKNRSKA